MITINRAQQSRIRVMIKTLSYWSATLMVAASLSACCCFKANQADPVIPPVSDIPSPDPPGPEVENTGIVPPPNTPLGRTPRDLQQMIGYYRISDLRVVIIPQNGQTDAPYRAVSQELIEQLTDANIRVVRGEHTTDSPFTLSATRARSIARQHSASLVLAVRGEASHRATLGQIQNWKADVDAELYNAAGDLVARRDVQAESDWSQYPEVAERQALEIASEALGKLLQNVLINNVEANLVIDWLTVENVPNEGRLNTLIAWLKNQKGVNRVELEQFNLAEGQAVLILEIQPALKGQMAELLALSPDKMVRLKTHEHPPKGRS